VRLLYLEPFEGGSHAAFTRAITRGVTADWTVVTLPGRHWKWRMRGAPMWWAQERSDDLAGPFDGVLASAYVDLPLLMALAPAVARAPRALYFHENQLAYPMRPEWSGERDLHYGFTQMASALAADRCWFNSEWNRDSFLDAGQRLLASMPDHVPGGWAESVAARSEVLPLPLHLPDLPEVEDAAGERGQGPIILWNHRWEHDKAPETFVATLRSLHARGAPFRVAICGDGVAELPADLAARTVHVGRVEERDAYWALLSRAHLAVSTAAHEFFGVSLLEAVHAGVRPVAPDRLAYRETLPAQYRYASEEDLVDQLERLCRGWSSGALDLREDRRRLVSPYRSERVLPRYDAALQALVSS